MSDTPKSHWVIDRNYFTVKPVDNFKVKYFKWLEGYDPFTEHTKELNIFLDRMIGKDFVQVYEFPCDNNEKDYFEMVDDNHVIPRHLFDLVSSC